MIDKVQLDESGSGLYVKFSVRLFALFIIVTEITVYIV